MSIRSLFARLALVVVAGCGTSSGADGTIPTEAGPTEGGPAGKGPADEAAAGDAGSCNESCANPAAAACLDDRTLRAYATQGSCTMGTCLYTHYDVLCAMSCQAGACRGDDACKGVVCVTPPAPA